MIEVRLKREYKAMSLYLKMLEKEEKRQIKRHSLK